MPDGNCDLRGMPGEDANDEVLEDVDLSDNHHLLLSFQMGDALPPTTVFVK